MPQERGEHTTLWAGLAVGLGLCTVVGLVGVLIVLLRRRDESTLLGRGVSAPPTPAPQPLYYPTAMPPLPFPTPASPVPTGVAPSPRPFDSRPPRS